MAEHYTQRIADLLQGQARNNAVKAAAQLQPPKRAADGREIPHGEWIAWFRDQALTDPHFLLGDPATGKPGMLNEMAPPAVTLPSGKVLRSQIGLEHFNAAMEEALPEVVAAYHLNKV